MKTILTALASLALLAAPLAAEARPGGGFHGGGHGGGDLGAIARDLHGLVHHQHAARAFGGGQHGLAVPGPQRAQVDHFGMRDNVHAHRRSGKVLHVQARAHGLMTGRHEALGRFQRSAQTVGGTANGYTGRYFFDGVIEDYYRIPERIKPNTDLILRSAHTLRASRRIAASPCVASILRDASPWRCSSG